MGRVPIGREDRLTCWHPANADGNTEANAGKVRDLRARGAFLCIHPRQRLPIGGSGYVAGEEPTEVTQNLCELKLLNEIGPFEEFANRRALEGATYASTDFDARVEECERALKVFGDRRKLCVIVMS